MKRFVFKLTRLERLREIRERQARIALAEALARRRQAETRSEEARLAYDESLAAELPAAVATEPRAWRERAEAQAVRRAGMRLARREARREEADCEEVVQRHAVAAREHRALQRLHERRQLRWREESEREEQKFLDEVHLLRVARERDEPEVAG